MHWMQFLIELARTLAWPTVLVVALLALRRPLAALIPLARRLKYKDLELEFGHDLQAIAAQAEGAFPELRSDRKAVLIASARNLPNAAVLEAWRALDEAAVSLLKARHGTLDQHSQTPYREIEEWLVGEAVVDTKKGKIFGELRQLRNKVAHARGFRVHAAEAIQYIELCFKLIEHFADLMPANSPRPAAAPAS